MKSKWFKIKKSLFVFNKPKIAVCAVSGGILRELDKTTTQFSLIICVTAYVEQMILSFVF